MPKAEQLFEHIVAQQAADGSFPGLTSSHPTQFEAATATTALFHTALILEALTTTKPTHPALAKAAQFLMRHRSQQWSWNYWPRTSERTGYPDDLDDTFAALLALARYNPKLIDGKGLAAAVTLLTVQEVTPGGPYRTWLVPANADPAWKDVDLVVNSTIATFLKENDVVLPAITQLQDHAITKDTYASPYYYGPLPVLFFLARSYQGKRAAQLIAAILKLAKKPGDWGSPLKNALAARALLSLNVPTNQLQHTLALIRDYRAWPAEALYLDPAKDGAPTYHGSTALTASYCFAALSEAVAQRDPSPKIQAAPHYTQVLRDTSAWLNREPAPLREIIKRHQDRVLRDPIGEQIILLPHWFAQAYKPESTKSLSKSLAALSQASLCGWIAYTLYDRIYDQEADLSELGAANVCLRHLVSLFQEACPNQSFQSRFHRIMSTMEAANVWEEAHLHVDHQGMKKLPQIPLRKLAEKSAGHSLSALAASYLANPSLTEAEADQISRFFHHFLIARQLNDDLHDWQDDLAHQRLTPVVVHLLKHATQDQAKQEAFFWQYTVPHFCRIILRQLRTAQAALSNHPTRIQNLGERILEPIQRVATTTWSEQHRMQTFLQHYHPTKKDIEMMS